MSAVGGRARLASWRDVRAELLRRIHERVWRPGETIPNESQLAEEFGCARATINRALRDLAEKGLVTRKRRAGTQVARIPATHAMLRIPILREEVEALGLGYRHTNLRRRIGPPPSVVRHRLDLAADAVALEVTTLHLAAGRPYALDARWINLDAVPEAESCGFDDVSPNEWLVRNAPYTHGDIAMLAETASDATAEALGLAPGAAVLVVERSTWRDRLSVTTTRISHPSGYRIRTAV